MAENDYISKITLPSGDNFLIKDQQARADIQLLKDSVVNVAKYRGVVAWSNNENAIYDGSTSVTGLTIDGDPYTPENGDVVIVGTSGTQAAAPKEFIFRLTNSSTGAGTWNEFGSTGSLKALAFKDNAKTSYTPAGTITQPTFNGTVATISVPYKAAGTISTPSFSGTTATITVTSEALQGKVNIINATTGSVNYTPSGTVSRPTFSGSQDTVGVQSGSGESNYTPEGSVSAPTLHVTTTNSDIYVIQKQLVDGQYTPNVGSLPVLTTTVMNENLTIGFNSGTLPVCETKSVANGISESYADSPTFQGVGTHLSVTYTPRGTVSTPSFSGTGARLQGELDGTSTIESTGTYRPAGSVSRPTFTGTTATASVKYTPAGTVTTPTFNGTASTITVS